MKDIRWEQRLENYKRALDQLGNAVSTARQRQLSDLERQGLIQSFEFTHELAWNVMKDYLNYQGITEVTGSRDASREAFKLGLIGNGDVWIEMITSRNKTTHTYNRATADEIAQKTMTLYFPEFETFYAKMLSFKSGKK